MSRLWLSSLLLSHVRSHKRSMMSLDARPVVLFGPNGAGKTNVLEAVSFLSPGRGLRRSSAEDLTRRPEALGWKIAADLHRADTVHELETASESGAARRVTIDGKTAPQAALGNLVPVVWLVPVMDRIWVEGAEGRRRFLDRLTLAFRPDHATACLTYDKLMRERNRLLKNGITDPAWYGALEQQVQHAGIAIHAARLDTLAKLEPAFDGAPDMFPRCGLTLIGPDGDQAPDGTFDDLAGQLARTRARDLAAGRTLIGPHRADLAARFTAKDLPARDCSTGEQKALLLSVILAHAKALQWDSDMSPLVLLDEVGAHLDATRRAALYDYICALGVQAWMTGTGPELFEALGPRAQYFEVTESEGTSRLTQR